jgi:hypothetical protein
MSNNPSIDMRAVKRNGNWYPKDEASRKAAVRLPRPEEGIDPKRTGVLTAIRRQALIPSLKYIEEICLPSLHRCLFPNPPSPGLEIKLSAYT